jgi:hypothetical protein
MPVVDRSRRVSAVRHVRHRRRPPAGTVGGGATVTPEWVKRFITAITGTAPPDFVGRVEVNIFKGSVSNVNVVQSFKEDQSK